MIENEELVPNNLVGIEVVNDEKDFSVGTSVGTFFTAPPVYDIMTISAPNAPLVTIKPDGTVVIHHLGAEQEAAKLFWASLELQGKSLFKRIDELETENKQLKVDVEVLENELMEVYGDESDFDPQDDWLHEADREG